MLQVQVIFTNESCLGGTIKSELITALNVLI
jgi:hypothetical protein